MAAPRQEVDFTHERAGVRGARAGRGHIQEGGGQRGQVLGGRRQARVRRVQRPPEEDRRVRGHLGRRRPLFQDVRKVHGKDVRRVPRGDERRPRQGGPDRGQGVAAQVKARQKVPAREQGRQALLPARRPARAQRDRTGVGPCKAGAAGVRVLRDVRGSKDDRLGILWERRHLPGYIQAPVQDR